MSERVQNLELAHRIIGWELAREESAADVVPAIERSFRRLYDALSPIVGSGGFRAFFLRAIDLSKGDHGWLGALALATPVFGIPHLAEQANAVGAEAGVRGMTVLFATLLDLLCAFIGEELTLRNVRTVWTEIPADGRSATIPPKERE